MKEYIIDACIAVKWYLPEIYSERAREVLNKLDHFVVPDLFLIEMDNILTKKIRKKELSLDEAENIFKDLNRLPFISISYKRFREDAFFISSRYSVTQYDACYLALAVNVDGLFYTADQRFLNSIKNTAYSDYVIGINDLNP